jgi:lipopolysaccharide/colanic/teichoic acid biosynthesis glycosyltransferase
MRAGGRGVYDRSSNLPAWQNALITLLKRLFDMTASLIALVMLSPVLLAAAIGIRLSSRGPVFFRAERIGRDGKPFIMHKFRTMHVEQPSDASAITARDDKRVFRWGSWLRRLKIDELPQLFDILRGKMSVVGPRPEDPKIVRLYYAPEHRKTLMVRPGLASPGSIYNYTHGERLIGNQDPEGDYLQKLLPVKLALELVYVRRASLLYDFQIILRTMSVIVQTALGKQQFSDPPEMAEMDRVVPVLTKEMNRGGVST